MYVLLCNSYVKFHAKSARTAEILTKVTGAYFLLDHFVYLNRNYVKYRIVSHTVDIQHIELTDNFESCLQTF